MEQATDQERGPNPLKELREKLGMSQQVFATRLGVSIVSVGRWERGDRTISLTLRQFKALIELLREAKWDLDDFLDKACDFEVAVA